MSKKVKLSGIVATLAILVLEGCALINPHVTWQRPDPPTTLDQAIKYANDGREAYKKGMATYTTVPNVLAMALIPLGAGTIGAGIGGRIPRPLDTWRSPAQEHSHWGNGSTIPCGRTFTSPA